MVLSNHTSVQMKPVRVLLQDILHKSQEGTTADMVPETMVGNCDIKSHMNIHTGEKPFSGSQGNELFEHSSPQSNNEDREPPGELCLGPNSEEAVAKKNRKISENDKKPYNCSICYKLFAQNDIMIIHMQTHTKEKPFTCIVCSKPFSLKGSVTRHMRIHTGEKPFSCVICNKLFLQRSDVKCHMRIHTSEKPFSCKICNRLFNHSSHVKRHMRTHTGEKLFSCSHCNKSFAQRNSWRKHIMSETCKTSHSDMIEGSEAENTERHDMVPVKVCKCGQLLDKKFENTSLGIKEMADKQRGRHCFAHNCKFKTKQPNRNGKIGQKPKVNKTIHACSICMQSFPTYYKLKAHMQNHTKDKLFTCTVCSKPFSRRSHRNAHLRIHRGEKPFSCVICKKLFSQRSNMNAHMRTHSG